MARRDLQGVSCDHYERNEHVLTVAPRLLDIDDFIESLWKVHIQVKSEGYVQVRLDEII